MSWRMLPALRKDAALYFSKTEMCLLNCLQKQKINLGEIFCGSKLSATLTLSSVLLISVMALLTNSKINISAINVGQSIVRNASSLSIADVVSKIFSISSKIGRDALNAKCSYRERKDATI